jgi:hypothetical protein
VPNRIELASGEIVQDARISAELIPSGATCIIMWPGKPTAVSPAKWQGAWPQLAAC